MPKNGPWDGWQHLHAPDEFRVQIKYLPLSDSDPRCWRASLAGYYHAVGETPQEALLKLALYLRSVWAARPAPEDKPVEQVKLEN